MRRLEGRQTAVWYVGGTMAQNGIESKVVTSVRKANNLEIDAENEDQSPVQEG